MFKKKKKKTLQHHIFFIAEISSFHQYYQHYVVLPNIPIVLDDLICTGDEISLLDCYHVGINNHNCKHYEDIVVTCRGKITR